MSRGVKHMAAMPNVPFLIESKTIATLIKIMFFGIAASAKTLKFLPLVWSLLSLRR